MKAFFLPILYGELVRHESLMILILCCLFLNGSSILNKFFLIIVDANSISAAKFQRVLIVGFLPV